MCVVFSEPPPMMQFHAIPEMIAGVTSRHNINRNCILAKVFDNKLITKFECKAQEKLQCNDYE